MASINYIDGLIENSSANRIHHKLNQKEGHVNHKINLKSKLKSDTGYQRSFGDISNRIGRSGPRKADNLKSKVASNAVVSVGTSSDKTNHPFSGPEFRPNIEEVEDYADVFPQSLCLTNSQMNAFSKLWNFDRKKEANWPPSPPHSLELLPQIDYESSLSLELAPVEDYIDDTVFSLPTLHNE